MSRIAVLRKAAGLTQRQLADAVEVTETTIRNWENNRSGLEMFIAVARLCHALECKPGDLVEFVKEAENDS
ncbi:MAG: helix-turn-helix transcriptional regulator [Pseudanabaenales cyanobacterium]|nr:helix-turn-helix transcriptional regulator [Pseudanabaenales cyanobacterium]